MQRSRGCQACKFTCTILYLIADGFAIILYSRIESRLAIVYLNVDINIHQLSRLCCTMTTRVANMFLCWTIRLSSYFLCY